MFNDIQSVIKVFADDRSMSLALKNSNIRADISNSGLKKGQKIGQLKFNEETTKLLDQNLVLPLKFEGTTLQHSAQYKHLGIILQNNCKWDAHIKSIASKVNLLIFVYEIL